jgi:peptidoglycan/xylan/chitin deacetylase (PgdA/CDA1 family)
MRAAFFVPTGYIAERKIFWWERIALALSSARRERATLAYPQALEIQPKDPKVRRVLTDVIKNTRGLDVQRFLDGLCEALGVEWSTETEAQHAEALVMSWDQVRALTRAGMDVESHTRWHRVLQTLSDDELREELTGSREELEGQLGRPVRAIAYPVGRRVAHIQRIREAVLAAGYKVGVSNASGATRIWPKPMSGMIPTDPFDICRLSTDAGMSDAMYFTQIAVPRLAYYGRHDL